MTPFSKVANATTYVMLIVKYKNHSKRVSFSFSFCFTAWSETFGFFYQHEPRNVSDVVPTPEYLVTPGRT